MSPANAIYNRNNCAFIAIAAHQAHHSILINSPSHLPTHYLPGVNMLVKNKDMGFDLRPCTVKITENGVTFDKSAPWDFVTEDGMAVSLAANIHVFGSIANHELIDTAEGIEAAFDFELRW